MTKNLKISAGKRAALIFYIIMFAFPVAQFCVFYIGVNANSILLAFKDYDSATGNYSWVGFENFWQFMQDVVVGDTLKYAVKNSLLLYASGLFIGMPLTLVFSYYMYKKMFAHGISKFFLFLPCILPGIVVVILFNSFVSIGLPALGIKDFLADLRTQFGTLIFFTLWCGFGPGVLIYSSSMSQISPSVTDAAKLDGASSLREFWSIVLPSIFPTLITFLTTGVAGIFINQGPLFSFFSFGADIRSYTLGYYLFIQVMGFNSSVATYPYASAAGLVLTIIAAPLTLIVKSMLEKFGPNDD